jgi:2-hydroxychromene-2-carboxylate isomerase
MKTKTVDWYFDFISPFAYLQSEQLDRLPQEDIAIVYRPVLFAGLLDHWGSKGPAELPAKRIFTYRYVHWLAQRHRIALRMPPQHPFNPLRLLRLAIALQNRPDVIRQIFRFVWAEGHSADDPNAWQELTASLALADADAAIARTRVKNQLRSNTDEAAARGVFGVPTFIIDEQLFWGFDATDMVLDYLAHPALLSEPEMLRISQLPAGAQRR